MNTNPIFNDELLSLIVKEISSGNNRNVFNLESHDNEEVEGEAA
ncbi:hypothetical protein [Acinetobacter sp. SwsAc5]|nr:hypothetical protein [Acinetobacter sp. SwsAc5]